MNSIARNLFRARFRTPLAVPLQQGQNVSYGIDLDAIELGRLLDRCSGRDRALLEKSLQGYSAEEIARNSGVTPTGIRVRMLRVRQALRQKIAAVAV